MGVPKLNTVPMRKVADLQSSMYSIQGFVKIYGSDSKLTQTMEAILFFTDIHGIPTVREHLF